MTPPLRTPIALYAALTIGLTLAAVPPAVAADTVAHVGVGFPRMLSVGARSRIDERLWYGGEIGAHWPGFFGPGVSGRLWIEREIWAIYGIRVATNLGAGGGVLWVPDCTGDGACDPTGAGIAEGELILEGGHRRTGFSLALGLSLWYVDDDGRGADLALLPSARVAVLFF